MSTLLVEPIPQSTTTVGNCAKSRLQFSVQGVVQGVGFRPFVYCVATRFGLSGFVYNGSAGVTIEVEGPAESLAAFEQSLRTEAPPLAHIEQISVTPVPVTGDVTFAIVASQIEQNAESSLHNLVPPDLAICNECLSELFDPANRRYRYPFINCTNCGPRFTIIRDLPYDRPLTTMADFALCPECSLEYGAPDNRRFHAEPTACPNCGPHLEFHWSKGQLPEWRADFEGGEHAICGEAALDQAQQVLIRGGTVAIKGIGGFHLACDATNREAVARLRQRKQRADKPLAIMARDLGAALQVAQVNSTESMLLTSRERPIVLVRKKTDSPLVDEIAPGNSHVGIMLPYSPLHHLLFAPLDQPTAALMPAWLVMTSGNHADEPIVTDNGLAINELASLADCFLTHNRAIHVPCDDSVLRAGPIREFPIRRARGYAPLPIKLPFEVPPILAVGGQLKNTFCLAKGKEAFLSQHIGDMQDEGTFEHFGRNVAHMERLFGIQAEVIARDLHPGYLSTRWAQEYIEGFVEEYGEAQKLPPQLVKVQHHHAHIAALLAEHQVPDRMPVIGFCFDGTGYGCDGAIWGGEVLVADYRRFERVAHLNYFPLPGGDMAIRRPCRSALAALWAAGIEWDERLAPVAAMSRQGRDLLQQQLAANLNCVATSSMGRLFDAVAALTGLRQQVSYEAQAAIELETLVDGNNRESYHFLLPKNDKPSIDATPVLMAVVADVLSGVSPALIATRFHNAVANLILDISLALRPLNCINTVALSGGVFQNVTLLRAAVEHLQAAGFEVLVHHLVPPNDGGLALGQAVVAAATLS